MRIEHDECHVAIHDAWRFTTHDNEPFSVGSCGRIESRTARPLLSVRAMRSHFAVAAALIATTYSRIAPADALRVTSDEAGSWAAAVAMLQADLHGEGRVIHVRVRDSADDAVVCGEYSLVLDAVANGAFEVLPCDPVSGATPLRLVHRAALFDETDIAPRPLAAGLTAVQVRTGGERGGARRTGASEVRCTVAVRPYLEDLEHGRRVFLTPGRFVLRPIGVGITASVAGNTWLLEGSPRAAVTVEYDVLDRSSNEVVVHTRAILSCGSVESNSAMQASEPAAQPTPACSGVAPVDPAHPAIGSTAHGSSQPVYVLHLDRARHLLIDATSDFDGEADVYAGCDVSGPREAIVRITRGNAITQSLTLPPGDYAVAVEDRDTRRHAGAFAVRVRFADREPESPFR